MIERTAIRRFAEPALVASALAAIYLMLNPLSPDHAAQTFRSGLFEQEGLATWNNLWFGGHHLPGYSCSSRPSPRCSAPARSASSRPCSRTMLFASIAHRRWGERASRRWSGSRRATSISLFTGRLTFALGVAVALGAVLAAQRGYRLTASASPLSPRWRARSPASSSPAAASPTGSPSAAVTGSRSPPPPSARRGAARLRLPGRRHRALRRHQLQPGAACGGRRSSSPCRGRRSCCATGVALYCDRAHRLVLDRQSARRQRDPDGLAAARPGCSSAPSGAVSVSAGCWR